MVYITDSLEWSTYETTLINKTRKLAYGREVRQMTKNIYPDICALSKAEVATRRGNRHATEHILMKINSDIELIEEYLLVAALIG